MRGFATIKVLALAVSLGAVVAVASQPEAVMTIAGIPGQISISVNQTDWSQVQGMPDPRSSEVSGFTGLTGPRANSPLTSRVGSVGGRDQGSTQPQDFSVEKYLDSSSPSLRDKMMSGERMERVTLEIVPAASDQRTGFVITMMGVAISRIVEHPATGREGPTETVTFTCQSLEWESLPSPSLSRVSTPANSLTPRPR
jgi:type VI protein secretion system component Hcp